MKYLFAIITVLILTLRTSAQSDTLYTDAAHSYTKDLSQARCITFTT